MRSRTVAVAHRDAMVAEGIAAAIGRYPVIVPIAATTSAAEAARLGDRLDAVVLDVGLPDAELAAAKLWRKGARVVFLGEERLHDEGVCVPLRASVTTLVAALVPGADMSSPRPRSLTSREQEILSLVSRGLAAKQVARCLGISPKTVERHKTRIYIKLGVPNQAAAVSAALAQGIVGGA